MLLFNDMKERLQRFLSESSDRRYWVILLFAGTVLSAFFAIIALGSALFSTELVAGPDFVVASPETDPTVLGTVTVTPIELQNTGLRIVWGVASATVLAGVALLFWAASRLVGGEPRKPVFDRKASVRPRLTAYGGGILIAIGSLTRSWLTGAIGRAGGIEPSETTSTLDLWVFDVPPPALFLLGGLFAWFWGRGNELQSDADKVV